MIRHKIPILSSPKPNGFMHLLHVIPQLQRILKLQRTLSASPLRELPSSQLGRRHFMLQGSPVFEGLLLGQKHQHAREALVRLALRMHLRVVPLQFVQLSKDLVTMLALEDRLVFIGCGVQKHFHLSSSSSSVALVLPDRHIRVECLAAGDASQIRLLPDHNRIRLVQGVNHFLVRLTQQVSLHTVHRPFILAEAAPHPLHLRLLHARLVLIRVPVLHKELLRCGREPTDLTLKRRQSHNLIQVGEHDALILGTRELHSAVVHVREEVAAHQRNWQSHFARGAIGEDVAAVPFLLLLVLLRLLISNNNS